MLLVSDNGEAALTVAPSREVRVRATPISDELRITGGEEGKHIDIDSSSSDFGGRGASSGSLV